MIPEGCRLADFGVPSPSPSSSPSVPPASNVAIDPVSLRKILFEGNTAILTGMNRVHQSKELVNIARGNLLPSVNLGAMLSMGANGGFSLSSIEFLLPFLLPSRWFDYGQMKHLLKADIVALQVLKANQYASAFSLYEMIAGDVILLDILNLEVKDLSEIEAYVERSYQIGIASKEDYEFARGQAALARVNLSKVTNLVTTEKAALRHALGLSLETQFSLDQVEVTPSEWENREVPVAVEEAMARSLESRQMQSLAQAAKDGTWSKIFGFISTSSFRGTAIPGESSSVFSQFSLNQSIGIGFAYYPSIQLSQLNEDAIQIRQREVRLETTEIIEKILTTLSETQKRLQASQESEKAYYQAYLGKLRLYKLGLAELSTVLQSRVLYRTASVEVLNARVQVMLSRIVLHRAMLTDQFSEIQGCAEKLISL